MQGVRVTMIYLLSQISTAETQAQWGKACQVICVCHNTLAASHVSSFLVIITFLGAFSFWICRLVLKMWLSLHFKSFNLKSSLFYIIICVSNLTCKKGCHMHETLYAYLLYVLSILLKIYSWWILKFSKVNMHIAHWKTILRPQKHFTNVLCIFVLY